MSEQLANLYSTTLASGYTAGSGSISVSSATGAPTVGTFSLTILDASTGNVILIFRVASVSGTTFTGASEGPDSNAASASIVVGTILSAAAIAQIKIDAGGGGGSFIQPLTAPVAANFTPLNFSTGSGVVTTQSNNSSPVTSISLTQNDPSATDEIAALSKAKLAATFTVTVAFSGAVSGPSTNNQSLAGVFVSDGTNLIIFALQANAGYRIPLFSNINGSFSSDVLPAGSYVVPPFPQGPLVWLRIQETASARNYQISADGVLFFTVFTETNTAHFTTTNYGFALENRSNAGIIGVCWYSFTETNP